MFKRTVKWIGNFLLIILIAATSLSFYGAIQHRRDPSKIPSILGFKTLSVLSGSMRPILQPGDLIISKDVEPDQIKIGDIVTYRVNSDALVTHRVIGITEKNGELAFETKGDANNTEDGGLVLWDQLVGSFVLNIPRGGYIVNFIRSPIGFILLILVPVFLLLGGEIKNILSKIDEEEKDKTQHKDNMKI